MGVLLLFLLAGCLAGWLLRRRTALLAGVRRATQWALWALLALMGARLAQDRGAFAQDPSLLLWAVGSSLLLALVLFGAFGLLRLAGLRAPEPPPADPGETQGSRPLRAVLLNAGWIALGVLAILLLRPARPLPLGPLTTGLLDLLLLLIGYDLGAELHRLHLRGLGLPILAAPFLNIALTLGCGLAFAWLRGLPIRQGLLLYAGLGWYSLAPVMIAGHGLTLLAALAFIHNLTRELLAILTAPLAARISPYLPVYLGGATTMDVMLPFVQRYSGRAFTLASFFSGLVCSLAVAPLVRLLLG